MSYEEICANCENFKEPTNTREPYDHTRSRYTKGHCDWYQSYYYRNDDCNGRHFKPKYESGGCYITTIVADILGYPDDTKALKSLRKFRDEVLQKDEQYAPLLFEYDVVGPQIAKCLKEDQKLKRNIEIPSLMYKLYIEPTARFVEAKKYPQAIKHYCEMVDCLKMYYGIELPPMEENYDATRGGHGRIYSKKILI